MDTLVLGCTHYPLLREVIGAFMGPEVTLVNSGRRARGWRAACGERSGGARTDGRLPLLCQRFHRGDSLRWRPFSFSGMWTGMVELNRHWEIRGSEWTKTGKQGKAMTKDVIISIRGMQAYDGADKDSIELMTEGTLSREENGWTLSSRESRAHRSGGTTTTIQVEGSRCRCSGPARSPPRWCSRSGSTLSLYDTPYGAMELSVAARRVRYDLSETGGRDRGHLPHRAGPRHGGRTPSASRSGPEGKNDYFLE